MFLIALLIAVLIGVLVVVGPALIPLAIIVGIGLAVYKGVEHHRHHGQNVQTH